MRVSANTPERPRIMHASKFCPLYDASLVQSPCSRREFQHAMTPLRPQQRSVLPALHRQLARLCLGSALQCSGGRSSEGQHECGENGGAHGERALQEEDEATRECGTLAQDRERVLARHVAGIHHHLQHLRAHAWQLLQGKILQLTKFCITCARMHAAVSEDQDLTDHRFLQTST